jgi:xanthine dehydrogenase small subunit
MLHGKELITVENLKSSTGELHPVQQALVDTYGSQCGFCTPGFVMSLFALYQNHVNLTESEVRLALVGNLCRCTGYKPIVDAAVLACATLREDHSPPNPARVSHLLKTIPVESIFLRTDQQTYFRPVTIREAMELKDKHVDALVANGATDVALRVTKKHELLPLVLDLSGIEELRGVAEEKDAITVAAGVSIAEFSELCRSYFPAIGKMLSVFGSVQVRNLATIGGNLGTASPVGDLIPALIAHKAQIVLRSLRGERRVEAAGFVSGYRRSASLPDELITAVILPRICPRTIIRSYKVSKRRDLDIATVSGGFRLELENGNHVKEIILAYGGMSDRVQRAENTEAFLQGKIWDRPTIEMAMRKIDTDFTPISDARGSATMRKVAARNLLLKFWAESTGNGDEP